MDGHGVVQDDDLPLEPTDQPLDLIVTEKGVIHTEHVVNSGGLWAKQCGLMAGVDLPVTPMEHHYLVTEKVEGLANLAGAGAGAIGAYVGGPLADRTSYVLLFGVYATLFALSALTVRGIGYRFDG